MPKRNLIWAVLVVLAAAVVVALTRARPLAPSYDPRDETFAPLVRIHELAKQHYYDAIPPEASAAAIKAYLRELDPYCRYIPPSRQENLDRLIAGQRVGIGLHYAIEQGRVKVVGAMLNSPSMKARLHSGDKIVTLDGEPVTPSREWMDEHLTGEKDTKVSLGLLHSDGEREKVNIDREVYDVASVTGLYCLDDGQWEYWLDRPHGIAYVRINEFVTGTGGQLEQLLRPLLREGVQGLVLDLRDNPGGPLPEAIDVADLFLDDGLIVVTKGLHSRPERHLAQRERTLPDFPVVLLVNGNTISAPEIVAGSLKRQHRAVLLGGRTYGKDYIQSIFDLGNGLGTVTLTTARYYFDDPAEQAATQSATGGEARLSTRPAATEPADPPGVAPDVLLETTPAEQAALKSLRYEMEVLPALGSATEPATQPEDRLQTLLARDRQLAKALHLLRTPGAVDALLDKDKPAAVEAMAPK